MHIKPRELIDNVPAIPEHGEDLTPIFIITLMLLGILRYLFIYIVIPFNPTVICDFLRHSYEAAGA